MFKNEKLTHLKFSLFKFEGKKRYIYIYREREIWGGNIDYWTQTKYIEQKV